MEEAGRGQGLTVAGEEEEGRPEAAQGEGGGGGWGARGLGPGNQVDEGHGMGQCREVMAISCPHGSFTDPKKRKECLSLSHSLDRGEVTVDPSHSMSVIVLHLGVQPEKATPALQPNSL